MILFSLQKNNIMRPIITFLKNVTSVLIFLAFLPTLNAQVTTATLSGLVKSTKGDVLGSATVTVEYPDAGIIQTLSIRSDGRFTVPNLRVGGPYKVSVNYVGYQPAVMENILLELGLNNTVEFTLQEKTTELGEVTVTASGAKIFDNKRTGASTNINNRYLSHYRPSVALQMIISV